jgi:hypothetical protein
LDGNTPEELTPGITFLGFRTLIVGKFTSFTTYELDRLTIPIPAKVKGDSSWNSERQFRAELEKAITEICCDEILDAKGATNP